MSGLALIDDVQCSPLMARGTAHELHKLHKTSERSMQNKRRDEDEPASAILAVHVAIIRLLQGVFVELSSCRPDDLTPLFNVIFLI